jgi:WD40 repeat protein
MQGHEDILIKLLRESIKMQGYLTMHAQPVICVAFLRDDLVTSADCSGMIKLISRDTGTVKKSWDLLEEGKVTFSACHASTIAAGCSDGLVLLFDAEAGKELCTLRGHTRGIISGAFSADGNLLASTSWDETVRIWDISVCKETIYPLGQHALHNEECVCFNVEDGEFKINGDCPVEDKRLKCTVRANEELYSVAFTHDSKLLVAGNSSGVVKIWNLTSGKEDKLFTELLYKYIYDYDEDCCMVHALAFSPDGKLLAVGGDDFQVSIWDISNINHDCSGEDGEPPWPTSSDMELECGTVSSLAFSADGKLLASGHDDNTVTIWNVASGKAIQPLNGHTGKICSVAFSPDGQVLASGSYDKSVRIWNVATGTEVIDHIDPQQEVKRVAFSPDGKLVASCNGKETVRIWDVASGKETRHYALQWMGKLSSSVGMPSSGYEAGSPAVDSCHTLYGGNSSTTEHPKNAVPPDASLPAAAGLELEDQSADLDHAYIAPPIIEIGEFTLDKPLVFSPDFKLHASIHCFDKSWSVKICDAETGVLIKILGGPAKLYSREHYHYSAAFSADSKLLACVFAKEVWIWDLVSGLEAIVVLAGNTYDVYSVAFSPDSKLVASSSSDKTVRIWEVESGKEAMALEGHTEAVLSVAFSPEGKLLASCGERVRIWDVSTGEEAMDSLRGNKLSWNLVAADTGDTTSSGKQGHSHRNRSGQYIVTAEDHSLFVYPLYGTSRLAYTAHAEISCISCMDECVCLGLIDGQVCQVALYTSMEILFTKHNIWFVMAVLGCNYSLSLLILFDLQSSWFT